MAPKILTLVGKTVFNASDERFVVALVRPMQMFKRFLTQEQKDKGFVDKPTPYEKADRQCILCRRNVRVDYKNPRILAQFVSPLNGQVYDKHITGLCEKQQTRVELEVKKAKSAMLMPFYFRDPKYNKDPPLFNPDRPQRPNPY